MAVAMAVATRLAQLFPQFKKNKLKANANANTSKHTAAKA
jgi:hypothetical protein